MEVKSRDNGESILEIESGSMEAFTREVEVTYRCEVVGPHQVVPREAIRLCRW